MTVTQSNWRTNEETADYMGIINVRCVFRAYCFSINRALFLWCFYFFELVNMRSIYSFKIQWKFSVLRYLMQSKQNLKQTKTFRDFRVFDFALYSKSKTRISRKNFFNSNFERSCNLDAKATKSLMIQKLKDQDMFWLEEGSFRFCLIPKIENSEISESVILLQILTVVVT